MKNLRRFVLPFSAFVMAAAVWCSGTQLHGEVQTQFEQNKPLRIALVSFKTVVEKSKRGQKEQAGFDAMKKQMESILEEKEKALTEVAAKFNDIDYLDSLSPDAEAELKRQFRTLNQEFTQQQNQFYQTLSQTNVAVIQKLNEIVTQVSSEVAKKSNIDIVLNEESCFFSVPSLDISPMIIRAMDEAFEKEAKESKPTQGA